jgi:hypothetical protein
MLPPAHPLAGDGSPGLGWNRANSSTEDAFSQNRSSGRGTLLTRLLRLRLRLDLDTESHRVVSSVFNLRVDLLMRFVVPRWDRNYHLGYSDGGHHQRKPTNQPGNACHGGSINQRNAGFRPVLDKRIIKGRPFGVGFDRSHLNLQQGAPS